MSLKYTAIRAMFEALWLSRLPHLIRTLSKSRGVIFTLHRVLPEKPADFSPNAILQVQPDFLDYVIERVRALGLDIVTLDEAMERLAAPEGGRQFVVLTFDDAYKDNLQYALPILRKHQAPFTLYVPTALVDGVGELWWQAIEDVIARQDAIALTNNGHTDYVDSKTTAQKNLAFNTLYWQMRKAPEPERLKLLRSFTEAYGYDLEQQCRALIMDWQELKAFASDPLCTIGAHTVHHYELAKLPLDQARSEIEQSADILLAQFGKRPAHLSYPLGGPLSCGPREFDLAKELGFATAVTTRPGGLYAHHAQTPLALPRVSLNGLFQSRRFVDVFATGAIFSVMGKITG
ncbi:MAG: polysaccharide deacetylase family protein [Candidatus Devosia phytovorans]|uniref:Chitooligosaccharide deacetylase n=1 Tax=Candidatus Devosia phytovorans TaxID=3121372 RepID=A0AAJ6B2G9_9HYPH|nr:polysaccharide deacetylase family protein [Devosia sp.]WEK06429.1 MAG: polysaccharide deacetylase family protein [Devosia sp.]